MHITKINLREIFFPQTLYIAERNKNKYSIETLETMMSTVKAEMAPRKEFDGFLNVNFNTFLLLQQIQFHFPWVSTLRKCF